MAALIASASHDSRMWSNRGEIARDTHYERHKTLQQIAIMVMILLIHNSESCAEGTSADHTSRIQQMWMLMKHAQCTLSPYMKHNLPL